jgi:hypothetical protein
MEGFIMQLQSNGQAATIKKLDVSSQQESNSEFLGQVSMVSRLKHEHVVELMGLYSYFCAVDSQSKQSEPPAQLFQVKDGETEPLIIIENGSNEGNDSVGPKGPVWASNKDLHA